jgi:hypothetical protein
MGSKRRKLVRFSRTEDFGRLCVALNENEVPFTLNGFYGIVLLEKHYNAMTDALKKLAEDGEVTTMTRGDGKRPPSPPVRAVEDTIWKLAKTHIR